MNDLKFAFRQLAKSPGFTIVAVLTLALGIGVNTAIFTMFNALALRPIPVKDPASLVSVYDCDVEHPDTWNPFSYPAYTDYRDLNSVFAGLAGYVGTSVSLDALPGEDSESKLNLAGGAAQLRALLVTGNYFGVLGGRTILGRMFSPEECQTPGAPAVVVLSHRFWQRRCGSDTSLVGKMLTLHGHSFTVIGIAAAEFVGNQLDAPDLWVPLMMQQEVMPGTGGLDERDSYFLQVIGRLKPGVSRANAQAGMDVLAHQLAAAHPESNRSTKVRLTRPSLVPAEARKQIMPIATLVLSVVSLLMLIACTNVANLLLARVASRQREFAVRLAIGASRARVLRQLVTESTVLGLLGGFTGLILGSWITRVLVLMIHEPDLGVLALNFAPDVRVAGYALGLSLACVLVIGLVPALQVTRLTLSSALKKGANVPGLKMRQPALRNLLVIVQLSVCLVLLICAGLLVRGLQKAQATDPGFDMKHVLVVHEDLQSPGYNSSRIAAFYDRITERLRTIPGVQAVSLCETVPLGDNTSATGVQLEGRDAPQKEHQLVVGMNRVSPTFFETLKVPLLEGRSFTEQDCRGSARVAIVNEVLAKRLWPGLDPVGRRYRGSDTDPWTEVVGIARDTRSSALYEANEPYVYVPYSPLLDTNCSSLEILVRTQQDPKQAMGAVRAVSQALDPNLRPSIKVLEQNREAWIAPSKVGALLSSVLGFLGLLLTSLGLYGVISFVVGQRTHEIGVRIALGASRSQILQLVLRQGLLLVSAGLGIGLTGALALSHVMGKFLFGLSPLDPVAFGGVSFLLVAIAMLTCYWPARRATKVDPLAALRYE
jgi:predicted permease